MNKILVLLAAATATNEVLAAPGIPTYKTPTGTRWEKSSYKNEIFYGADGQCVAEEYWTGQCTACPAHYYQNCPRGGTQTNWRGCGFLSGGCEQKCKNNCMHRKYGCYENGVKDLGCGCGVENEDCLYTVPDLQKPSSGSNRWSCGREAVDYHVANPSSTGGNQYTKTCAQLKEMEWCTKNVLVSDGLLDVNGNLSGMYAPLWMQAHCAATCGHCNQSCNLAEDRLSRQQCVNYRRDQGCKGGLATYMEENCAGTCGYCKSENECQVLPVADSWETEKHPTDTTTCAEAASRWNICAKGNGAQHDSWYKASCQYEEQHTFACRMWSDWSLAGPKHASQCAMTCGICGTCDSSNCAPGQIFMESECKGGHNGCMDVDKVLKLECKGLQIPPADMIIEEYCTDGMIDVIASNYLETEGIALDMTLSQGGETTFTRSTTVAFTNEKGWDLSSMDETMHSTTEETTVEVKDPEVSDSFGFNVGLEGEKAGVGFGVEFGYEESFSSSCMNQNTEWCEDRDWKPRSTLSDSQKEAILKENPDQAEELQKQWAKNENACKCVETTTTTSETSEETHSTTAGQMGLQTDARETGFEESTTHYHAEDLSFTCPEYSECMLSMWSVTATCAIPYWGTCTIIFDEKDSNGNNIRKDIEIQAHEKNKFVTHKTARKHKTYIRNSGKTTDGSECGVKITPAVDNSQDLHISSHLACPAREMLDDLPHCDCMLERFQDCSTPVHQDDVLKNGDLCQLGNRVGPSYSGYDTEKACLSSRNQWVEVGSCFNAHIYVVGGYNQEVYNRLYEAIHPLTPNPTPAPVPNPTPAPNCVGPCCWEEFNSDSGGQRIPGVAWPAHTNTVEQCAQLCIDTPLCNGFHYYGPQDFAYRDCYLKQAVTAVTPVYDNRNRHGGFCGNAQAPAPGDVRRLLAHELESRLLELQSDN